MTRSEQFRKSRAWLRISSFVITNSLKAKLETVPENMRRGLCFIQNMVLVFADEYEETSIRIPAALWQNKLGSYYKVFVSKLEELGELKVGHGNFRWSRDKTGYPMPYIVPLPALESGTCILDFESKRVRLPRPKNKPTDAASAYALRCLSQLKVAETLRFPPPKKPTDRPDVRRSRIRMHCEHIFSGDFSLRYGKKAKRLYHRVVMMPSEGRCNLSYWCPLAEYDVRTCHPLLMLNFFTDPTERARYAEFLSGDIYSRIAEYTGIVTREQVKEDFQRVVNIGHKTADWMAKQYVLQFYYEHFPVFAVEVLFKRTDLARTLQNLEARLLVQHLGSFCRERDLFWVPMHDGFIARFDRGDMISEEARRVVQNAIGFTPQITRTPLNNVVEGDSIPNPL